MHMKLEVCTIVLLHRTTTITATERAGVSEYIDATIVIAACSYLLASDEVRVVEVVEEAEDLLVELLSLTFVIPVLADIMLAYIHEYLETT